MSAVAAHRHLVLELCEAIDECITALVSSGTAFPDPDLPDRLEALGDRAVAIGLEGAAVRLRAVAGPTAQVTSAPSDRGARADRAFAALLDLIAWMRVFRALLELELTRADLATAGGEAPSAMLRVALLGLEQHSTRVVLHGVARGTGQWVQLRDDLPDLAAADPLHHAASSRLLQDRVLLHELLRQELVLPAAAAVEEGGVLHVAPTFGQRPVVVEAAAAPPVPRLGEGGAVIGPARVGLRVAAHPEIRVATVGGAAAPLAVEGALRLALAKLLVREGGAEVDVDAVVAPAAEGWMLLRVDDRLEGAVHPGCDPRAFALSLEALLGRAGARDPGHVWLRHQLASAGGAQVPVELPQEGPAWAFRAAVAGDELGDGVAACAEAWVRGAEGPEALLEALWVAERAGVSGAELAAWAPSAAGGAAGRGAAGLLALARGARVEALEHLAEAVDALRQGAHATAGTTAALGRLLARAEGGADGLPPAAMLGVSAERLLWSSLEPLLAWTVRPEPTTAMRAGDGLWLARDAGIVGHLTRGPGASGLE